MRRRLAGLSLTVRFAIVSVVPLIVIALVLGRFFEGQIRERSLTSAERAAVVVATALRPEFQETAFEKGLDQKTIARIDRMRASLRSAGVSALRIADSHGRIIYADRGPIGMRLPFNEHVVRGLASGIGSRIVSPGGGPAEMERYRRVFQVYTPISDRAHTRGLLGLDFRFHAIADAIDRDTKRMYWLLLASFGLLYAALLPTVGAASRRLRRQAKENEYLALHDHLTGLPNRLLFDDRLEHAIRAAKREQSTLAVLLMDVDRFKEVNDTLGHRSGDELLQDLADRLETVVRESDTIARLGGDEFAILLPEASYGGSIADVVARIQETLAGSFTLEGLPLEVEASIGVAIYPNHGEDGDTLLRRADVAMYLAKRARSGHAVYSFEQDEYNPQRLALVGELRRAIEQRELFVEYQPKASMADGRVDSVEALVRWSHPTMGRLSPEEFIPVAEHTGLIDAVTTYVLDEALRQCRRWLDEGREIAVSVNISTRNLLDRRFSEQVGGLLGRHGVHPGLLELEITESSVLADPPRATRSLLELSAMGLKLSMDDFGTGYSSFTYLTQLPVDKIKIDKSFVLVMADDEQGAAIVRSTIDVARNLSLEVIAEGVETEEIWERLTALGCDTAQGFFLSRPMRGMDLPVWLDSAHAAPAIKHLAG